MSLSTLYTHKLGGSERVCVSEVTFGFSVDQMKGSGLHGHLELPKPSRELIGVKSHDELQMLLLVSDFKREFSERYDGQRRATVP